MQLWCVCHVRTCAYCHRLSQRPLSHAGKCCTRAMPLTLLKFEDWCHEIAQASLKHAILLSQSSEELAVPPTRVANVQFWTFIGFFPYIQLDELFP